MKNLNTATATQTTRQSVYAGTGEGRVVLFTTGSNTDVVIGNPPFFHSAPQVQDKKESEKLQNNFRKSLPFGENYGIIVSKVEAIMPIQTKRVMNMKNLNTATQATATQKKILVVHPKLTLSTAQCDTLSEGVDLVIGNPPFEKTEELQTEAPMTQAKFLQTIGRSMRSTKTESKVFSVSPPSYGVYDLTRLTEQQEKTIEMNQLLDRVAMLAFDGELETAQQKNMINRIRNAKRRMNVESVTELYPESVRLQRPIKGAGFVALCEGAEETGTTTLIDKVLRSGPIYSVVDLEGVRMSKDSVTSKFSVVTNTAPYMGRFNTLIVENNPSVGFGRSVCVYEVDTREEANQLVAHFNDPQMIMKVAELSEASGSCTFNKLMLARLPGFEEA